MIDYTYNRKTQTYVRWFGVASLTVTREAVRDMASYGNWGALRSSERWALQEGMAVFNAFRYLTSAINKEDLAEWWGVTVAEIDAMASSVTGFDS